MVVRDHYRAINPLNYLLEMLKSKQFREMQLCLVMPNPEKAT